MATPDLKIKKEGTILSLSLSNANHPNLVKRLLSLVGETTEGPGVGPMNARRSHIDLGLRVEITASTNEGGPVLGKELKDPGITNMIKGVIEIGTTANLRTKVRTLSLNFFSPHQIQKIKRKLLKPKPLLMLTTIIRIPTMKMI